MATVAFGAAAAGIASAAGWTGAGAGVAGAVAAAATTAAFTAAGAYIDQTYVFPAIFGKDAGQLHGPRIDDFQIMTASPGSPAHVNYGREVRVPGTVIWLSELKRVVHEETVGEGMGGKGGSEVVTRTNFISLAVSFGQGPQDRLRKLYADGKVIYENLSSGLLEDDRYTKLTYHDGNLDQAIDPDIDAILQAEGKAPGDLPAYRGVCYVTIVDLNIGDFGNRVPNITAVLGGEEQTLLSEAVNSLLTAAGREVDVEYDVRWLQGEEVRGYTVTGPQVPVKALEPLFLAFDVVAQEEDGVTVFRIRRDTELVTIAQAALAARELGEDAPRRMTLHDNPGFDLPREVDVTYVDPDFFWQRSNQRARRFNAPGPGTSRIEIPITMTGSEAKALAQKYLWTPWAERTPVDFTLPPSHLHVLESDLVLLTADGAEHSVRVSRVSRGRNGVIEVRGVTEQSHVLTQEAVAEVPDVPPEVPPQTNPATVLAIMELPLLRDGIQATDVDAGRQYFFGVCLLSPGAEWRGATLYSARVTGGPFSGNQIASIRSESTIGRCLTALPATGGVDEWDRGTVLDVELYEGTLESRTEEEVLAGYNHLAVHTGADSAYEIVAFVEAELLSPRNYRLTKLLRGRRDTVDRMTGHAVEDLVVLLSPAVRSNQYDERNHNKSDFFYRAVPRGSTLGDVPSEGPYLRSSRAIKPFSPAFVRGTRGDTFDLTVSWVRRTYAYHNLFDLSTNTPMLEPRELYDLELYRASDDVLVRTERLVEETSFVYTAAAQTGDGITPGPGAVKARVYQISTNYDSVGRGNPSALVTM